MGGFGALRGYPVRALPASPQLVPLASESQDGLMSFEDKIKLDSLTPGPGGLTLRIVSIDVVGVLGQLIAVNSTAAPRTVTLPPAAAGAGQLIVYSQYGANGVTVTPNGGDTIGEAAGSVALASSNKLFLFSDGVSDWMIISP